MNINLKNQSNIINNSKIKFKGQKLLQCCVFFASSNVNRVVKYVLILPLSSQSDYIFWVNGFEENVYQLSCKECVNIEAYFTTRFTFVGAKHTHTHTVGSLSGHGGTCV